MRFIFLTLFPQHIQDNLNYSILQKAIANSFFSVTVINPRDFATNKHQSVDDTPYGGGGGMLLMPQPWIAALQHAKTLAPNARVIALAPHGKVFNHTIARTIADCGSDIIFLCGHYEGFDWRIYNYVDEFISLGDYVLTGGELAALIVLDACVRFIPGVLGCDSGAIADSFTDGLLEYPQYTKPYEYLGHKVPDVLTSGNHSLIERWRRKEALKETYTLRPDLLRQAKLNKQDGRLLLEIIDEKSGDNKHG